MAISNARFNEYLQESIHKRIYKIEFLRNEDESPYLSIESDVENGGSVNTSFNEGVRRTSSFRIINNNLQYNDVVDSLTIRSKYRISLGYEIDGEKYLIPRGVYFFSNPTFDSSNSSHTIDISGVDKWAGLNGTNGGILEGTYLASAGTNFADFIKSLLVISIVNDVKEPLIDTSLLTKTLPFDITRGAGSTVSDMILEACFALSSYCYYSDDGRLVVEPFIQDTLKGSVYTFDKSDINYLTSSKTQLNDEVFNSVQITADNTQSSTVLYYEAINNRLDDKNSFANVGVKKVKPITNWVKGITTQSEIEFRASWELQRYTLNDSTFNISCRPIYGLDVNQVVRLDDDACSAHNERCLIYSISEPIGTSGTESITAKKALDSFE